MRTVKRKTKKAAAKEPVYTGPRKGYAAMFLGESSGNDLSRIRAIHSKGIKCFLEEDEIRFEYNHIEGDMNSGEKGRFYKPCWYCSDRTDLENIELMKLYDLASQRETIFLGYVKDTE